jgi:biotin carboxylase
MWIVFIEISPTFRRAFEAAHELGLKILWIGEGKLPEEVLSLSDKAESLNELSFDSISNYILNNFEKSEIKAFWALKDKLIPLTARLTFELGNNFRFPTLELVHNTKNKIALREILKNSNYNPDYFVFKNQDSKLEFSNPFPNHTVVIKPPLGYASIGVEKVGINENFNNALKRSFSVLNQIAQSVKENNVSNFDSQNTLLVEKFIAGIEYSVEVFANEKGLHVLGICSKSEMVEPFFEEVSYCLPASIDETTKLKITNAAIDIAKKINLNSGMAHIELIVNDEAIKVLDIGLRLGGSGLTHDLIFLSHGIDLVKAVLSEISNLNNNSLLNNSTNSIALLYLLQIGSGGIITKLPNIDELIIKRKIPEYIKTELFVNLSDNLQGYPKYSGLPGYVLFKILGSNISAYQRCDEVLELAKDHFKLEFK